MIKNLILLTLALVVVNTATAQTVEEYKSQIAAKNDQIAALQGEVGALEAKILEFPGWTFSTFGVIGVNFAGFNNWANAAEPNSGLTNISVGINGRARLNTDKYFWSNDGKLNLGWTRNIPDTKINDLLSENPNAEDIGFSNTADALNISSLFGYKLTPKIAASALGEYRTTVLENFNDPGYLDIGIGATWLPFDGMTVTIHPLNYNFVFSDGDNVFESSVGAKYVIDYSKALNVLNGVAWSTKFSGFYSYKSSDLNNWTWTNTFAFTAWRGIGIGAEFGLRSSDSEYVNSIANASVAREIGTVTDVNFENVEAKAAALNTYNMDLSNPGATGVEFETSNPIQSYWLIGLTYSL